MIEHSFDVPFRDRDHAALQLLEQLLDLKERHPVVLGIPRGAVPMARVIAAGLNGELDLMLAKRIPQVGAVTEDGEVVLDPGARMVEGDLEHMALEQIESLRMVRPILTGDLPSLHVAGRVVVIVDESLVTGATMCAAVRSVRNRGARRVVVAAPLAAQTALARIEREGATVRALNIQEGLREIRQYYLNYPVIDDQTVHACFLD